MPLPDLRLLTFVVLLFAQNACTSKPPTSPDDLCDVFTEKRSWYKHARSAEKNWGMPIEVGMSFIHKESSYRSNARPERTRILWVIPWKRPSSAYGYAQATDAAWRDYRKATGRGMFAERNDLYDALDFIGWYNDRSARKLGINRRDAYNLYLAYYLGLTGYERGDWRGKPQVKDYAQRVASRASGYARQLERCEGKLRRKRFFF